MYSYYFGQHSVKKYLDKGVIIVIYEEEPDVIPPPAVVIYPINSNTTPGEPGIGWKFDVQPLSSLCALEPEKITKTKWVQ